MTGDVVDMATARALAEAVALNRDGRLAITHVTGDRWVVLVAVERRAPAEYRQLRALHKQWFPPTIEDTGEGAQDD